MSVQVLSELELTDQPWMKIAKAELAKVKDLHDFDLQVVNIQDRGQETWKRKYVYWIPVLHLDGEEIAKGRWGASNVLTALRQRHSGLYSENPSK
ncbi:hypothetical protein F5141DRAFT_798703 [Pisolithus sp. B1]|nr:hypothetical protein F5141DRAFT_798703 [Pisolithus sp. B1]